jgi:hypothetical protein
MAINHSTGDARQLSSQRRQREEQAAATRNYMPKGHTPENRDKPGWHDEDYSAVGKRLHHHPEPEWSWELDVSPENVVFDD